jgi:malate dehydrogenase (oxaloacetate-decarboxylating)(NADP+)
VVDGRPGLGGTARSYAIAHPPVAGLVESVRALRPTALIGVSGQPNLFTRGVLEAMAEVNSRPAVFALSNPTSHAECSAEQAYRWTGGRVLYSSGSPCVPVELDGRWFAPSQTNNAYVFPGLGLAVVASGTRRVTEGMFLAAASALAGMADEALLAAGALFPPIERIREVSLKVAVAVARVAVAEGLATRELPDDLEEHLRAAMYQPVHPAYVEG